MSSWHTGAVYCVAIVVASIVGGAIPRFVRLTHTRMQVALSFVAGVMLGIGLLHLLPHGFFALQTPSNPAPIDKLAIWAMGGFLSMFFLERFFHFHHHEAPEADSPHDVSVCQHEHDHPGHAHDHHRDHHCDHGESKPGIAWLGALVGMTLHGLMDGMSLAASMQIDAHAGHVVALAGLGTFLAVVLHKPFDALAISTLLQSSGASESRRVTVNLLYAMITPIGLGLFYLGLSQLDATQRQVLGVMLSFAGGAFLCIAASDLLPELQFHSHDRVKLSIALALGVALAWGIVALETSGHGGRVPAGKAVNSEQGTANGERGDR